MDNFAAYPHTIHEPPVLARVVVSGYPPVGGAVSSRGERRANGGVSRWGSPTATGITSSRGDRGRVVTRATNILGAESLRTVVRRSVGAGWPRPSADNNDPPSPPNKTRTSPARCHKLLCHSVGVALNILLSPPRNRRGFSPHSYGP